MGSRRHVLLVLPVLLAAMGGTQGSAYASDGIGLVADFATAVDRIGVETPEVLAMAAGSAQVEASTDDAPTPPETEALAGDAHPAADDEASRRTIFEIIAEARSRIGFLPESAASAEIVRAGIGNDDASADLSTARRTIFDILAQAHGNPRFLAKESLADAPARQAAAEPSEETILPPDDGARADNAPQSGAADRAEEATVETPAEADGFFVVPPDDAAEASDVTNEPCGHAATGDRPSETDAGTVAPPRAITAEAPRQAQGIVAEALPGDGLLPQQAATPEPPGQEIDGIGSTIDTQTHSRVIIDILAEARGNPRFLAKNSTARDSPDTGWHDYPSTLAAEARPAASTDDDLHAAAREAHRRKVLETVAEARSRIGFLPPQAARLEHAGTEPTRANPALAAEAPRRTIFDVLAEAHGSPGRLTTQSALAQRPTHGPAAEPPAAPNPDSHAKIGDAAAPAGATTLPASEPAKMESLSAPPNREPVPTKARAALLAATEIDAERMERLRGGFEAPGGLRVSFGIERAVIVNGVLQSSTQVGVTDLGRAVGGTNPGDMAPAAGMAVVIQNGVNNSTLASLPAAALATVVQNSLDNQHLQTITRINAIVNSAEMLRTTRMQQTLQDSLNRAALAR